MNRFRLQRWLNRISFPNLMTCVVIGMGALYVLQMLMPSVNLYGMLALTRSGLLKGEIWRLLTFVFLPPSTSIVWVLFSLYFSWMIGVVLENQWGSPRFTLFYLVGMIGSLLTALITGYADNTFLNLSLFFAFAAMNPDYQLLIMFIIPVKVKYLALLDAVLYLYLFIVGGWSTKLMILLSLGNVIIFLGGDILNGIRRDMKYWKTRRNFRRAMRGR